MRDPDRSFRRLLPVILFIVLAVALALSVAEAAPRPAGVGPVAQA